MDLFVFEDGKTLRCGFTTGTAAAMAALASARLLITGQPQKTVSIMTPKGVSVQAGVEISELFKKDGERNEGEGTLEPEGEACTLDFKPSKEYAVCAVRKDGGDDKDVTDGLLIYAETEFLPGYEHSEDAALGNEETGEAGKVCKTGKAGKACKAQISGSKKGKERASDPCVPPEIIIEAGEGIGRVTKPGLSVPVGEPAINPVPRRMIEEALRQALLEGEEKRGIKCTIYVPEGKKAAVSTFNQNLGIEGGISIIGTTGIVEPMSKSAYRDAVCLEIKQKAALGHKSLILTPGNYGLAFLRELLKDSESKLWGMPLTRDQGPHTGLGKLSPRTAHEGENRIYLDIASSPIVMCSNFIGDAIDEAISDGYETVLIAGHAGKLLKLAGGIMNTHSRMADCRMELICAHAAICGAGTETCKKIMEQTTTDEAFRLILSLPCELRQRIISSLLSRVQFYLDERVRKHEKDSAIRIEAVIYFMLDETYRILGRDP